MATSLAIGDMEINFKNMGTNKLEWFTQKRRVRDLVTCAANPNINTDKQFRNLKKSLRDTGYAEIIAIDVDNKIVELFGDIPRVELFARKDNKQDLWGKNTFDGWDVWGNEVKSSIQI